MYDTEDVGGSRAHRDSATLRLQSLPQPRPRSPLRQRGGHPKPQQPPPPCRPQALRAVRGWLTPWTTLQRYWQAWSTKPLPTELQALLNALDTGRSLDLYRLV
ncbi:hypothetical protein [Streptomyces lydicus]|uniref:hypothetical protein n=1 Tax=Streptomyces lydicus TaxID=47763 RepID=UPI001012B561|nr:hypothetical protein [Streptomyces lydicus]MCZ1006260.1 hypothetical protein [Streptomyces lydicus]